MARQSKRLSRSPSIAAASDAADDEELTVLRPELFVEELGEKGCARKEQITQQELILKFLQGELLSQRNQERAKKALGQLLFDRAHGFRPLPLYIGIYLSTLFDPRQVKLKIEHRKQKPGLYIATDVARKIVDGEKWEAAVVEVATARRISRSTVTRAWAQHRKLAEGRVEWERDPERYWAKKWNAG